MRVGARERLREAEQDCEAVVDELGVREAEAVAEEADGEAVRVAERGEAEALWARDMVQVRLMDNERVEEGVGVEEQLIEEVPVDVCVGRAVELRLCVRP